METKQNTERGTPANTDVILAGGLNHRLEPLQTFVDRAVNVLSAKRFRSSGKHSNGVTFACMAAS